MALPWRSTAASTPTPARAAAACWLAAAGLFVAWMLADVVHGQVLRAEIGYASATALLVLALAALYRRASAARAASAR